ncbi:hypothetical protein FRC03_002327 [Tulasnella sp. 419]|nr:hypothetical protein FRC03_002327 [Tulasnella sp. 419]
MSYPADGSFQRISGPSAVPNPPSHNKTTSKSQSFSQIHFKPPIFSVKAPTTGSNRTLIPLHRSEIFGSESLTQSTSRDNVFSGSSQQVDPLAAFSSSSDLPLQPRQDGSQSRNSSWLSPSELGPSLFANNKPGPVLLPALPIVSSKSTKGKRRAVPSPPQTPPPPSTPVVGSPSGGQLLDTVRHPWDTPDPSLMGSVHGASVSPTAQRTSLHARQLSTDDATLVSEPKNSHPRTPVFGALQPHYRLRSPPRLSLVSSPHRESFARGRSSDEDGEGSPEYIIGGPSAIYESEEDFLRNVQRVVEYDQMSDEEERTPSPLPGVLGRTLSPPESYDRSTSFMPNRPSPLGSPRRDSQRIAGGELNRLLSERAEWERARRLEFDKRRPDYLRRWAIGDSGASDETSPSTSRTKRRPHTRRGRQRRLSTGSSSEMLDERGQMSLFPVRTRTTRAMDAREMQEAIAAVNASLANSRTIGSSSNGRVAQGIQSRASSKSTLDSISVTQHNSITHGAREGQESLAQSGRSGPSRFRSKRQLPSKTTIVPGTAVGITVSPTKGRRLKLLRPSTPPETRFSPPPTTRNAITGPPPTFDSIAKQFSRNSFVSHRMRPDHDPTDLDGEQGSTTVSSSAVEDGDSIQGSNTSVSRMLTQGRAARKRKRLMAFQDDSSASDEHSRVVESGMSRLALSSNKRLMAGLKSVRVHQSPLKPAFVEGLGRMAVNPNDLEDAQVVSLSALEKGTAGKKTFFGHIAQDEDDSLWSPIHTGGAGFRDIVASRSERNKRSRDVSSMLALADSSNKMSFVNGSHWPDSQFPWSLNDQQRKAERKRLRNEKMKLVERFLDRDTDDSLSDDEEDSVMTANDEDSMEEGGMVHKARDLSALGHDAPENQNDTLMPARPYLDDTTPDLVVPSDPGDARYAFASRRDIRAQLFQSKRRREESTEDSEDDGPVACICREPEDGRRMVRCDGCRSWFHQICVDILDENQLDDFWYCWKCSRDAVSFPEDGSVTPATTMVVPPTQPQPISEDTRPEQETDTFPSPNPDRSPSPFSSPPKSPIRLQPNLVPSIFSPQRTPRKTFDPTTPKRLVSRFGIDIQQTPRFFPEFSQQGRTAGSTDIMGSPSRGTQYSVAFATLQPRQRSGVPLFTPKTPTSRRFDGFDLTSTLRPDFDNSGSTMKGSAGGSSPPLGPYSMSVDYLESPIQRGGRVGKTSTPQGHSGVVTETPAFRLHGAGFGRSDSAAEQGTSITSNAQRNDLNDMLDI